MQAVLTKPLEFKRLQAMLEHFLPTSSVIDFATEKARAAYNAER
jgi:hypothetical protein